MPDRSRWPSLRRLIATLALVLVSGCHRPTAQQERDSFGNTPTARQGPDSFGHPPPRAPPAHRDTSHDVIGGVEITAGVCYGPCIPYRVAIEPEGRVTWQVTGQPTTGGAVSCPEASALALPKGDFEALAALARRADVTTLEPHYASTLTDHSELTTTVLVNGHAYTIKHPDEPPAVGVETDGERQQLAALIELHREIWRAARVDSWLSSCRHEDTSKPPNRR